ncbi:hypothetical protein REH81_04080 [Vibrio rotiferianus]
MWYNDSEPVLSNKLSVYRESTPSPDVEEPKENREFCEQIGQALVSLGTEEALGCMARMMCAIATHQGFDLEFNCSLGKVSIERADKQ